MAKYCVIGQGLIATALKKNLPDVSFYPTPDTQTIFYLDSVVHMDFEKNVDYHLNKVVNEFLFLLSYCKQYRIRFVYASSAMVYEKDTEFTRCKRALELLALCYQDTLALRIFPVYGNENRTIISKWCKEMKNDIPPTVFGDGTQTRDFIHVDDVASQILTLETMKVRGTADIGAGNPTSFNDIIKIINEELGKNLKPIYIDRPKDYSQGIQCMNPLPIKISLRDGIRIRLLEQ